MRLFICYSHRLFNECKVERTPPWLSHAKSISVPRLVLRPSFNSRRCHRSIDANQPGWRRTSVWSTSYDFQRILHSSINQLEQFVSEIYQVYNEVFHWNFLQITNTLSNLNYRYCYEKSSNVFDYLRMSWGWRWIESQRNYINYISKKKLSFLRVPKNRKKKKSNSITTNCSNSISRNLK